MMIFRRLALRNWRNFGAAEVTLGDRLFIVGANASGKSNLLDAFRFLKDVAADGLQKAVGTRGGIKKIRRLSARDTSCVEIAATLYDNEKDETWVYRLQFDSTGAAVDGMAGSMGLETVSRNGEIILLRKNTDAGEDPTSLQYTHLEHPSTNAGFRQVYDYFKEIAYVNIIPQLVRERDAFIPLKSREDYFGCNLLDAITSADEKQRDARLRKINEVLRLAVPQFSSLRYVLDENDKRPHLEAQYDHFRPQGVYQREDQFSDGTLRLIGLIWAIMDGAGLLLLEEPELYLHSEIVRQLPAFIGKAQKRGAGRRQVVMSSHGTELLDTENVGVEEIAVLMPRSEGTSIVMADSIEEVNNLIEAGFTPADAVMPQVTPPRLISEQLSFIDVSE